MSTLSSGLRTLSYEAFIYFYPLVMMDVTRLQALNAALGTGPGAGPPNHFSHMRAFPSADFRAVVRPNFDTPTGYATSPSTKTVKGHIPETAHRS
ncbi:DUF1254 domain-containing protein [Mycobacterium ulcerans]|uniref:DUF1254 domain-containing protein n=1 Tax=Mycobacterium ulcerans TaxID=1809 RepID=UPI00214B4A1C